MRSTGASRRVLIVAVLLAATAALASALVWRWAMSLPMQGVNEGHDDELGLAAQTEVNRVAPGRLIFAFAYKTGNVIVRIKPSADVSTGAPTGSSASSVGAAIATAILKNAPHAKQVGVQTPDGVIGVWKR